MRSTNRNAGRLCTEYVDYVLGQIAQRFVLERSGKGRIARRAGAARSAAVKAANRGVAVKVANRGVAVRVALGLLFGLVLALAPLGSSSRGQSSPAPT